MNGEKVPDERVIGMIFDTKRAYRDFAAHSTSAELYDEEPGDRTIMGTSNLFVDVLLAYCRKVMRPGMIDTIVNKYAHDLSGMFEEPKPVEARLFTNITPSELPFHYLVQAFDLDIDEVRARHSIENFAAGSDTLSTENHEAIIERFQDDQDTLARLVLTRSLHHYEEYIYTRNTSLARVDVRTAGALSGLIEHLVASGYEPLSPQEFVDFVEGYLTSRIRSDEDRLNPLRYVPTPSSKSRPIIEN